MAKLPNANQSVATVLMTEVFNIFKRTVQPSLVPIYAEHARKSQNPVQVGTGFLILHNAKPVLVTAKHTLRGHTFTEDPATKAVHVNNEWVYIGDGSRQLVEANEHDITMAYMEEFPATRCLSSANIAAQPYTPQVITFGGFLARDFKREGGVLRPAPRIYNNVGISIGQNIVGLRHPYRRNKNTLTGTPVVTATPSGLSGGPMIDTFRLFAGVVSIVGVFAEQDNGQAGDYDLYKPRQPRVG